MEKNQNRALETFRYNPGALLVRDPFWLDQVEDIVNFLELDVDNRRLALGHKQLEENPWDTFETLFPIGSVHKCIVNSKNDKGAVLELPYGLEGFATVKNLEKEDGSKLNKGDEAEFKIIEFNKDFKRVVASHTALFKEEEKRAVKAAVKKQAAKADRLTHIQNSYQAQEWDAIKTNKKTTRVFFNKIPVKYSQIGI